MTSFTKCDLCLKLVEQVSAKLYITPVLPGKPTIMANYFAHCDVCSSCKETLMRKMVRRKKRKTVKEKFPLRSDVD